MTRELWTGAALDQLLTACGIRLEDVKYRVVSGEWVDQLLTAQGIRLEDVKYRVMREEWDKDVRTIVEIEPMVRMS